MILHDKTIVSEEIFEDRTKDLSEYVKNLRNSYQQLDSEINDF